MLEEDYIALFLPNKYYSQLYSNFEAWGMNLFMLQEVITIKTNLNDTKLIIIKTTKKYRLQHYCFEYPDKEYMLVVLTEKQWNLGKKVRP